MYILYIDVYSILWVIIEMVYRFQHVPTSLTRLLVAGDGIVVVVEVDEVVPVILSEAKQ